jgi:hypothetical protein
MGPVAIATALFFGFPLLLGLFHQGRDMTYEMVASGCALREAIAAGEPFLVSTVGNGSPIWGWHIAQPLYPPRWVALALPPDLGATFLILFHFIGAAAGAFFLARTFRISRHGAMASGMAYVLAGPAVDLLTKSTYMVGLFALPWAWAMVRQFRRKPSAVGALGIALFVFALLVGGDPQALVFLLLAVLAEMAVDGFRGRLSPRRWALIGLAMLPGIFMCLPQWWPGLLEMQLGPRTGAQNPAEMLASSFDPVVWPTLLWPDLMSVVGEKGHALRTEFVQGVHLNRWSWNAHLGGVWLALLVAGVRLRRVRSAALLAAAALFLALGQNTPPGAFILTHIPGLSSFRYPEKYLVAVVLAASILGGMGAQVVLKSPGLRRVFVVAAGIFSGLGVAVAVTAFLLPGGFGPGVARNAALATLPVMAAAFLVHRRTPYLLLVWVLPLALFALGQFQTSKSLAPAGILGQLIPQDGTLPTTLCVDDSLAAFPGTGQTDHWMWQRKLALPELQSCDGLSSAIPYAATHRNRIQNELLSRNLAHPGVARAMGCRHILTHRAPANHVKRAELTRGIHLVDVNDPLPEVFAVPDPAFFKSERALMDAIALHPEKTASYVDLHAPAKSAAPQTAAIQARWHSRHDLTLKVEGGGPVVAGVRTAHRVGWQATQAGVAIPTLRIGGALQGVWIEAPEKGPVDLVYAPPGFGAAWAMAGLGLMWLIGLALFLRRKA